MSAFLDHLGVDYIDGRKWCVQKALTYAVGALGSGEFVTVPAGFVTDFASIPRGLWSIFPPTQYGKSACIHDALYRGGVIWGIKSMAEWTVYPTRGQADGIFREAIRVEGCGRVKAFLMWSGLRVGGSLAWKGHKETHGEKE